MAESHVTFAAPDKPLSSGTDVVVTTLDRLGWFDNFESDTALPRHYSWSLAS